MIGGGPTAIGQIVTKWARTWAGIAQVLAPQEKLNGVVASGDVCLATLLIEGFKGRSVDGLAGVIDDPGVGIIYDIVDVLFIKRPRVEQAFRSVSGVVDGTIVEAKDLCL